MSSYNKYGALDSAFAEDGDVVFLRINNRLRADQLKSGEVFSSINGRMDTEGAWQVRKGVESFGPTLSANTQSIQLLSTPTWKLYDATPIAISSATRSTSTITINTSTAHGFSSNTLVYVYGLSGTVDPNGNRLITVVDSDTFTFTIAGAASTETYSGTGYAKGAQLSATATSGVYGSCLFSDPRNSNGNYIVRATNNKAVAINLDTGASTDITYPVGTTINARCELLQCFDKIVLFRSGLVALEWNGILSGSPAFTAVSSGVYTQPVYFNSATNASIADGVVTVNENSHGLAVGDTVYVIDKGTSDLSELLDGRGDGYIVSAVPSANQFKFNAQVQDVAAESMVFSKRISSGQGFIHMPNPAWGVYHQRRLWVPYKWEPDATGATDRNVSDEIIASDILDSDTYDHIENQFRITAGIADYTIGVEPFAEDNLLVFNRHSIHLVKGISGELADTSTWLITKEIGCVARRSVLQIGNQVLFLSDNGVYAAEFGDLYNLRGAGLPLSEPIKPTMDRINRDYASGCVAAYYDNRYYLAFPIDSSRVNNAMVVYNFLNRGWESLDTSQAGWDIQNLIVGDKGGLGKLYSVSSNGSIHIIDEREDGNDNIAVYAGVPASTVAIESEVSTRQYTMGGIGRKVFTDYELHVESSSSESSNATIGVAVENYDYEGDVSSVATLLGDNLGPSKDASLRGRIGNKRGYGLQLVFSPTNGRPKLRAASVSATKTNQSISQAT